MCDTRREAGVGHRGIIFHAVDAVGAFSWYLWSTAVKNVSYGHRLSQDPFFPHIFTPLIFMQLSHFILLKAFSPLFNVPMKINILTVV